MSDTEFKFCKYCGKQIDSDSIYCSFCGKEQSTITKDKDSNDNTADQKKKESIDVNVKFATPKISKPDLTALLKKKSASKYDESYKRDYSPTIVGIILGVLTLVANIFGIEDPQLLTIIIISLIIFRIFIAVWCYNLARGLNRENRGWGAFGFFLPVVALIIIGFKKKLRDKPKPQVLNKNDISVKNQYVSVNNLPTNICEISINESYRITIQEGSNEFLNESITDFIKTIHTYDNEFPLICAIELDKRKVKFASELSSTLELYSRLLGFYSFIGLINSKLRYGI